MTRLNSFNKFFESKNQKINYFEQVIKDSLVEITDEGFDLNIDLDYLPNPFEPGGYNKISIGIRKPSNDKYKPNAPFKTSDIINSLIELNSQLTSHQIGDIYYHIMGYEPSTWYSANSLEDLKATDEVFDLMEIILVPKN